VLAAIAPQGIDPSAIDHVNAHATGTPTNDGVEALSISEAAPAAMVSAVKGAFGHTLGAAGVVEAVILAESMRRGIVPPSVGCAQGIPGVAVSDRPRAASQRVGVSVNLAFGGHNAALALRWGGYTEQPQ
jgi:3-oxoacyl-(acyl-carrier-protein) synthase